jgi:hypothetical protein
MTLAGWSAPREPDPARPGSQEEVASLLALGVAFVELVTSEDLAACPACRAVTRRLYATAFVPLPPIHGCAVGCGCRVAPLFLE